MPWKHRLIRTVCRRLERPLADLGPRGAKKMSRSPSQTSSRICFKAQPVLPMFFRHRHQTLISFVSSTDGNVAILFALCLIPIVTFMGMAIDYSRAARARSAMQSSLDSVTLMLSKDISTGVIASDEVTRKAHAYFKGIYTDDEAQGITITAAYTPQHSTTPASVSLTSSGHIKSDFMQIAGYPILRFNASSTAEWSNSKLRVALALDNTGSMLDANKITTLINVTAGSGGLIDHLGKLSQNPGDVLISIVPFGRVVNVAATNVNDFVPDSLVDRPTGPSINSNAINPYGWSSEPTDIIPSGWSSIGPGSSCPFPFDAVHADLGGIGCINDLANPVSVIPATGQICPHDWTSTLGNVAYAGCWDTQGTAGHYTHTWTPFSLSCISDTDAYGASSDTPDTPNPGDPKTLFPAFIDRATTARCLPNVPPDLLPVMPLTSNWAALKETINAMDYSVSPFAYTNQGIGLKIATQTLNPGGAFNAPAETDGTYERVIILLSDGLNSADRWPGDGLDTGNTWQGLTILDPVAAIDDHQAKLCSAINAKRDANGQPMYTVYTIQIDTGNDGQSTVLKNCASSGEKYYYLTRADQMATVFQQIASNLGKLRLAK